MKTILIRILTCMLLLAMSLQLAFADDVLTTIDEAVNQYKKGDLEGAASNLDYAAQQIRQKKSEVLKTVLPDPLVGWKAEEPTSQATGTAVFGKSVSVSRNYIKKPAQVSIDIAADSPVMQSLVMMLNNPVIAGAGGAKLEEFSTHKGIVQYDEANRSGDVNVVVDNRFLVTVKGQQVAREDLLAYAKAVKYIELVKK